MAPSKMVMSEIFAVTSNIQNRFPALYDHLNETPLFLSYNEVGISMINWDQYLESIKMQLIAFEHDSELK